MAKANEKNEEASSATEFAEEMRSGFSEFGVYICKGYTLVKGADQLHSGSYEALVKELDDTEKASPQHYIFDFRQLDRLGSHWGRLLAQLKKKMDDNGGHGNASRVAKRMIRIINCSEPLARNLKTEGLDVAFPICQSIDSAQAELGVNGSQGAGGSFDVKVVVPFINATMNAIETLTTVKSQKQAPFVDDAVGSMLGEVSGVIPLSCPAFNGLLIISFPKDTIFDLVGKITGEAVTEVNGMVRGAVGEFVNIAATSAKKVLNESGYGLSCDIPPQVTLEKKVPASFGETFQRRVIVPFETASGKYFFEIRTF